MDVWLFTCDGAVSLKYSNMAITKLVMLTWRKSSMKISKKQVLIVCIIGIYLFHRSDSNIWEKEFYYCADGLKSRIDQVDAYSNTWQAYINFVENWAKLQGGTPEEREEIYQQATLLMILIDDNHDGNYGFHDVNRKYCTLSYDHGKTWEELLSSGNLIWKRIGRSC